MDNNQQLGSLLTEKHARYFKFCLRSFSSRAQSEESNKLALVYFCLHGLGLLNKLDFNVEEKKVYSNFIYRHLIDDPKGEIQSFRASQTFRLPVVDGSFDLPNLSATLFALLNLLILESDYSKILNRHKIMRFVKELQVKSGEEKGSFKPVLSSERIPFGESDIRLCYIALCIRKLLKYDEISSSDRKYDIDVEFLKKYVLSRVNYDGGFSSNKWTESHSGLTFCSLACLKLLEYDFNNSRLQLETKNWLVHRQVDYRNNLYDLNYVYYDIDDVGGFNGRDNKFADTCYSWWVTGSLALMGTNNLYLADLEGATKYLLNETQDKLLGGFKKDESSVSDPLHSYFALASLSLWVHNTQLRFGNSNYLAPIDETLVITERAKQFWSTSIKFNK